MAQRHWTNLYGVLSRNQLDARKTSGEHSEAARPLSYLAEMFNDYQGFRPQNVMVTYVSAGPNQVAQLTTATASMASGAGTNAAENSAVTSEDVTAEANDEASCTGSEDEDSDGSL